MLTKLFSWSLLATALTVAALPLDIPSGAIGLYSTEPRKRLTESRHAEDVPFGDQPFIKRVTEEEKPSGFLMRRHDYQYYNDTNWPTPNKKHVLNVTWDDWAPAGYHRPHFLINGKYPADPLIWDEDDWIEITVNNESPFPFTIHWHGIFQLGTPQHDGVPGLSQWNIYYKEPYVYRFQVNGQYGAFWAHSHTQGYYADGLRLPIYIRPKPGRPKPWKLISDNTDDIAQMEQAEQETLIDFQTDEWNVDFSNTLQANVHTTGVPPACLDALLINGRGRQYCFANWTTVASPITQTLLRANSEINRGLSSKGCLSLVPAKPGFDAITVFDTYYGGSCRNTTSPISVFHAGKAWAAGRKWLNIQVIEATANWFDGFSIDGHKMWIVAVDGGYIEPMLVDFVQVTIGTRLSIMIELDESKAYRDWPFRFTGVRALQPIEGYALLTYNKTADDSIDLSIDEGFHYLLNRASPITFGGLINTSAVQWNQSLLRPFNPPDHVPANATVSLHAFASQGSLNVWQIADVPLDTVHRDDSKPILFQLVEDRVGVNDPMLPYKSVPFGSVVDIIFHNPLYSVVGKSNSPHPFHLHGHHFWVIGMGTGEFNYDTVADAQAAGVKFNLDNPPLRDGADVPNNAWMVLRYKADNPAPTLLHCHIDDHLMQGMAAVILEGIDQIPRGTFSRNVTDKPKNFRLTENEPGPVELVKAWSTAESKGVFTKTIKSDQWDDPRSQGRSLQSEQSALSVSLSISAASRLSSLVAAGLTTVVPPSTSSGASPSPTAAALSATSTALGSALSVASSKSIDAGHP